MTRTKSYRQTAGVATLGSNPSKNKIGYMLENPSIQNYFKEKFMANYMVTVLKEKDHSSQRNSLRVVCKRFAARNDRTATQVFNKLGKAIVLEDREELRDLHLVLHRTIAKMNTK